MAQNTFEYVAPDAVVIAGMSTEGMTVRAATGRTLGRLRGFVVDATHQHVRYLVLHATGLFGKTTVLPFAAPRLDRERHAIEVDFDDRELRGFRGFTLDTLTSNA